MRRPAALLAVLFLSCLGAGACGGNVVKGAGGAGTGAGGTAPPGGDCTSDAQCNGGQCVAITPGGYEVCAQEPPEATSCSSPGLDQCCSTADCKGMGKCYSTTALANCGGPAMAPYNLCVADQCTDDASCAGSLSDVPMLCLPAGVFGFVARFCLTAYCHTNADCTAQPGGACVPIRSSCCGTPVGIACVYPGGCSDDADCGQGNRCEIDDLHGTGTCVSGPATCPV